MKMKKKKRHISLLLRILKGKERKKKKKKKNPNQVFFFIFFIYFIYLVDELDDPIVVRPTPGVRTKQVAALPQRQPSPLPPKPRRQHKEKHPCESIRTEIRRVVNLKALGVFDMCELISQIIKPYLVNDD
jgi:hypothetical protein